ncbi:DUF4136 domain-containing protein [Pinibacter soli]|uniref:DUF4136 domain-containing protein n=1 Tax=Pinibacter soli TaxID=3044211 RepID=A0ABT6RFS2_9BACT|nr:DUF4136 domain-containing protein [Pinibacter soli]MDI3320702.1 DUF4136 domain-containing protein [Pinibacter soli]
MRKLVLFTLIASVIICSCSSKQAIQFSQEKMQNVDFKKYNTYAFLPTTDTQYAKLVNRTVLVPLMVTEVKDQLDAKGMKLDTLHPDCLFTYELVMKYDYQVSQDKVVDYSPQTLTRADMPSYNSYSGLSGGSYVRANTDPFSNVYYYSSDNRPVTYHGKMQIDTLREGSLVIDMIDAKSKEIVWRSMVKGQRAEAVKMTPEAATKYYIPKMLKKLPRK